MTAHPEWPRGPIAAPWRRPAAVALGVVWVALYNWWVPVAFDRRLMTSPDEFFSDLEATGRPDATLLQHLDLAAGLVLVVALLVRGSRSGGPDGGPSGRGSSPWRVAGAIGGQFSYACPEGLSASCRAAEWRLALPHHHYVHVLAGIAEFAFGTVAVYMAWQRTRPKEYGLTRAVRWTGRVSGPRLSVPGHRLPHRPLRGVRGADLLHVLLGDGGGRTAGDRPCRASCRPRRPESHWSAACGTSSTPPTVPERTRVRP